MVTYEQCDWAIISYTDHIEDFATLEQQLLDSQTERNTYFKPV